MTLILFPLVLIPITTSPLFPNASICRSKIWLKAKSLLIDVITEESVVKAIADNDIRKFIFVPGKIINFVV